MARATTKADLITAANDHFEKMWAFINKMSEEEQNEKNKHVWII